MLNETFLEMPYCQENFVKNWIEILLGGGGGGGLRLNFFPYLGPLAQN